MNFAYVLFLASFWEQKFKNSCNKSPAVDETEVLDKEISWKEKLMKTNEVYWRTMAHLNNGFNKVFNPVEKKVEDANQFSFGFLNVYFFSHSEKIIFSEF